MNDITGLTLTQTIKSLENKEFSQEELNKAYLERIKTLNPKLNAFLEVQENSCGIPAGIKDVFSTKGIKTTASSRILENYKPPYNATSIRKLFEQNSILIGKTNNDAFGFGSSTENSDYQVTHNPWNTKKVPGGSSGGSAAAVAAGMGVFSIAEDTGGSIRQPACFCGVKGIKVTYCRVSRYGVLAYL